MSAAGIMNPRQAAVSLMTRGAYGRAAQILRQWVLEHPDDCSAHVNLVFCFHKRQSDMVKWRQCDEFYEDTYGNQNAGLVRRFVRAEQLYFDDRDAEAIKEYHAVIDGGLDVPAVRHRFGLALLAVGRITEGYAHFDSILARDPCFLPAADVYIPRLFAEGHFRTAMAIVRGLEDLSDEEARLSFKDGGEDLSSLRRLGKDMETLQKTLASMREGNYLDAAIEFWRVFRSHTKNATFIRAMAFLFYRNDWLGFGRQRLIDELGEEEPTASYAMGLLDWFEDKVDDAIEGYDRAIESGYDHPLVRCARAVAHERQGETEKEEEDLCQAHARQPWLVFARAELAENALARSDFDRVAELADLRRDERSAALDFEVSGHQNLSQLESTALAALLQRGAVDKAVSRIENEPEAKWDERVRLKRAVAFATIGDFQRAELELAEAIEIDDGVIGMADDGEIKLIEAVAKQSPSSFPAPFFLALKPAYEGDLQGAHTRLKKLSEIHPENFKVWNHMAKVSWNLEDWDTVLEACRQALVHAPNDQKVLPALCAALQETDDLKGLRGLAKEFPLDTNPKLAMLQVLRSGGFLEQAIEMAWHVLESHLDKTGAAHFLIENVAQEDIDMFRLLRQLTRSSPFDFTGRRFVAQECLSRSLVTDCIERYEALFDDGLDTLGDVLRLALAQRVSINRETSGGKYSKLDERSRD